MRILGTICARGGSKGVPGKNLRPLAGRPLIAHTVEQALKTPLIDRVAVSTDSEAIAAAAREAGADVPFLRPAELSSDTAPKLPAIRHALEKIEGEEGKIYDLIVDLDPTSPLRSVEDIEGAVRTLAGSKAEVVFSVCEARKNPYFNMVETDAEGWARLSKRPPTAVNRRQDAPAVYELNASIYVYRRAALLDGRPLLEHRARLWEMPPDRSVDIDREIDHLLVETLLQRRIASASP